MARMGGLKLAVGVMSVLIIVGVAVIGVTITRRLAGVPAPIAAPVQLDEPAGTRIVGIAALPDRIAVQLQGGGPDRVRLFDAKTLRPLGELRLAGQGGAN